MRKGFLGSLAALVAGAGLTYGQPATPKGPTPPVGPGMMPGMGGMMPEGAPNIYPPGMMPPDVGMDPYGQQGGPFGSGPGLFGRQGAPRIWFGADYLYWTPKSNKIQYPMVTTSAPTDFGVVGNPTTTLLGPLGGDVAYDAQGGVRPWIGMSFDESGQVGGELSGFWIEDATRNFSFGSNSIGVPVLAVPFVDSNNFQNASVLVAFPGISTGTIGVSMKSSVWGGEANLVYNSYQSDPGVPGGLALLAGARYLNLRETFQMDTFTSPFGVPPVGGALGSSFFPAGGGQFAGSVFPAAAAPFAVQVTDYIRTQNEFYGGQLGFRGDIGVDGFFLNLTGKAGIGYMRQYTDLQASSNLTAIGASNLQPGGIYNLPQDLFRTRRDNYALLGEGGVNVGYQVGSFMRLQVGYTYLWVNNVVRPTRTISPFLNPNLLPVSPSYNGGVNPIGIPREITTETDFNLQGFNFGVQFMF